MTNIIVPMKNRNESLMEYNIYLPDHSEYYLRVYGRSEDCEDPDEYYLLFTIKLLKIKPEQG